MNYDSQYLTPDTPFWCFAPLGSRPAGAGGVRHAAVGQPRLPPDDHGRAIGAQGFGILMKLHTVGSVGPAIRSSIIQYYGPIFLIQP